MDLSPGLYTLSARTPRGVESLKVVKR